MEEKNIILIDWFAMSFRQKGISPYEIIDFLKLKEGAEFQQVPGRYRYRQRLSFGNIHILYDNCNPDHDYPTLEMSGQGCREFETFSELSFDNLFSCVRSDHKLYHMSRLDVAYDDHTDIFDIRKVESDYRKRNWVSNSIKGTLTVDVSKEKFPKGEYIDGISVMTGTKFSDMYMRIYDKAVERGYADGRHWNRCELVLKQDRAEQFILNPEEIGKKYRGVIHNYFRFVKPNKRDSNKRRWEMRDYWRRFLENAEKISVYTPKDIGYNLSHLHSYVMGQAGSSIETYIKCVGLSAFIENLVEHMKEHGLNAKQKHLINECRVLFENEQNIDFEAVQNVLKKYKDEQSK